MYICTHKTHNIHPYTPIYTSICSSLYPSLHPSPSDVLANVPLDVAFSRGVVRVKRICAFGLKNTQMMGGKQDPYVVLSMPIGGIGGIGQGWTAQTGKHPYIHTYIHTHKHP
jgi:hypothetical protein